MTQTVVLKTDVASRRIQLLYGSGPCIIEVVRNGCVALERRPRACPLVAQAIKREQARARRLAQSRNHTN